MLEMPRIRIEVERMKYQVIHAFADHTEEIKAAVEAGLVQAIATYPFEEEIRKASEQVITEAIKDTLTHYFKYGDGRKALDEVIIKAIQNKEG